MAPGTADTELSPAQARALAVAGTGLASAADAAPATTLDALGVVQLDSINAVARAHQLTFTARGAHLGTTDVDRALWEGPAPIAFDHPAHALSLVPLHHWPLWAFRRRATRRRPDYPDPDTARALLKRVEHDGPLTLKQLRGNEERGNGWDWGPTKTAVEFLVWAGELACTRRTDWHRVFDLPHRVIPARHLTDIADDHECHLRLLEHAGSALGVATVDDLADYIRIPKPLAHRVLPDTTLVPVSVHGWPTPTWAHPASLDGLDTAQGQADRAVLLNPFDNLIWYRPRVQRLFDFAHTLEAYKPAARRVHGYYVCPLLVGDRLVGRADIARRGSTLTVLKAGLDTLTEQTLTGFARACHATARAVGSQDIVITPQAADPATRKAMVDAVDTTADHAPMT
ncbi:winged helix-turn-helix domain-containing protein [Saccharothrix xinjiangensis]|uniref:Winged helix-turn-helix domain-containing protein n=1 Tax=Saccharothrix xinjiangensis TaxID=204798 RepID=A0ABV9XW14_9PSEU